MGFSDDVRRFTVKTETAHNKIVRAATVELFSGVIKSTPVLTGAARGAWATTVGKPSDGVEDRLGAGVAIAEVIANTPPGAGQETYLSNALPYIEALEDGSSTQAPVGMVRGNMDRVSKIVAAAIQKNRV